jgi:hypothetical protein
MVQNQKDEQVEASVLLEIEQIAKKESEVTKSLGKSEVRSNSLA